jgi:hypothetical protein
VICSIAELMKNIVVRELNPVSLVLNEAMLTYCDIITLTGEATFDQEWIRCLTPDVSMRFWGYLFESGNDRSWNKHEGMTDTIQKRLVPVGLVILNETGVSLFWMRMLRAIEANLPNFSELIPLIPRLFDAINSADMIRVLIDLAADIYSANLSGPGGSLEFVVEFVNFTAEFSAKIRAVIQESGGNSELETLLFCFWGSFFQLNDDVFQSEPCVGPMNAALSEFFICTAECHIDEEIMRSLLLDAWKCLADYFFPPHPLGSVVPAFFQLCVSLLNNGTDEDALRETLGTLAERVPGQLLGFVTSYVAEKGAPDRGIIVMVAENLEGLVKKEETREVGQILAEGIAQVILSTPIDDGCAFTFVKNFASLDNCQNYATQLIEWLYKMFISDPSRASEAFMMLAARRGPIIVSQRPDSIPAFAAFLPDLSFPDQSSHLISALLHLVNAGPAQELAHSACNVIGSYLLQVAAAVADVRNVRESAKLLAELQRIIAGPPVIEARAPLSHFTDQLVHSILRSLGDLIFLTEDGDTCFHHLLCQFLRSALQARWIREVRVLAEWCERLILTTSGTIPSFLVIPFLPVGQMPVTTAFLRELRVREDRMFNVAFLNLLLDFADRRDFTAFFQPEILIQLIDWFSVNLATMSTLPIELLERVLAPNLIQSPEFYVGCFEFLFMLGFRKSASSNKKLADLLSLIASKFEDRTPFRAVIAAHCDANLPITRAFISAVVDQDPPNAQQTAWDQFYKDSNMR